MTRPLIFLDTETTGIDPAKDRIVEISLVKVFPDGREETKTRRLNPEMHIPEAASAIHGIYDKDVAECPTFREIAKSLWSYMEGCDLAGYNSNKFDIPVLAEEFLRAGVEADFKSIRLVDVQNIFHRMEQRTLIAAYKFYCGKELEGAHSAEADTLATYEVLKAQLERYGELENDVRFLSEFSCREKNVDFAGRVVYNDKGVEVFNFGKHKGVPVVEVFRTEPSYYSWMMNGDFPLHTKNVITEIRLRELNNKG